MKTKKKIQIAIIVAVILIGCACVTKAVVLPILTDGSDDAAQEQQASGQSQDGNDAADEGDEESELDATDVLDEEQLQAVEDYEGDIEEVAALLDANLWVAESSTAQASFSDGVLVESREGSDDETQPFVIRALESSTEAGDGVTTLVYTGSATTADGDVIFRLSQVQAASGAEQPWYIECSAFAYSTTYLLAKASESLEVDALDAGLVADIGGDEVVAQIQEQLEDYCAAHYPTATHATWDGTADYDYEQGIVLFSFELDNQTGSTVNIMAMLGGGGIQIEA